VPTHQGDGLDGRLWEKYSVSIWDLPRSPEEHRLHHPAPFPLEVCKRLIEIYTRNGDLILDPFVGSGTTLLAAAQLGRRSIGIDINPTYTRMAKSRLESIHRLNGNGFPQVHRYNAEEMDEIIHRGSIDLIVTSPPYWNILTRKRTADGKSPRKYSSMRKDLGNLSDYSEFMSSLESVFRKMNYVLGYGRRCVLVVMDLRVKSRFIPLHIDVADAMQSSGFRLENIIIWDRRKEYNNLRPLGFPNVFVVNKVHEYILIFKKVQDFASLSSVGQRNNGGVRLRSNGWK
jgi:DNA modification methylase